MGNLFLANDQKSNLIIQSLRSVWVKTEFVLSSSQEGFWALMSHCFLIKLQVTEVTIKAFSLGNYVFVAP